jgi:LysM repeat protein
MRTMNKGRALVAVLALGALVAVGHLGPTAVHAQGTTVVIAPAQGSAVTCGEVIPQEVRINNVQGLYGVDVRVTFDPTIVEVVDANTTAPGIQITPGNFPDVSGGQGMVQVNNVDPAAGTISYSAIRLNPAAAQDGSGVIASMRFRGKANGSSPINLAWVMLSDKNARPIAAETTNGKITISGCTGTPATPATPGTPRPSVTPGGPTPVPPTPPPGNACQHIVKPGETLSSIARMYGTTVEAIMRANGLTNPNLIYVGQKLTIPNCGTGGPATPVPPVYPPQPPPSQPPSSGTCFTYIVRPGDTVSGIAARTGDTVMGIAKRNGLVNPNLIFAGQSLMICPGGAGGHPPSCQPCPPPPSHTCRAYYTVKPGDTLFRIAMYYGTTVYAISAANGLANPNWIYAGQTLCIP